MKNIRKILSILGIFIILFLIIFICIHFLSKGYTRKYKVKNYSIKEVYTKDEQDEHDNYYIEIVANNVVYNYQFYTDFKDNNKIVKDVLYYDGEYKCVLPILSDKVKVDLLCYKDNEYYNYQTIKGADSKLDSFVDKIPSDKYDIADFEDNKDNDTKYDKITYYKNNIPSKYGISITTLKGIISIVNNKVYKTDLFDKDVYKREISAYSLNYYFSANYNSKQEFKEVYIVNLLNGKDKTIKTSDYISFDSYIQGIVDNSVYIYDINNEKQYKVNLKDNTVTEVGNSDKGIKYFDGNWSLISSIKANNKQLFKNNNIKSNGHYYTYKAGNKLSGFYYYLYSSENGYDVYKANAQNKKIKKFLFSVKDVNDIQCIDDYIFYKDNDSIKLYSEYTGIKTIIENSELEFNENIIYNIYAK